MCKTEDELLPWIETYGIIVFCILFGITHTTIQHAMTVGRLKRIEVYALFAWICGNVLLFETL